MNKRPVILRSLIALVVIAVFFISIHPLTQRDFYETFKSLLKNSKNPVAAKLVREAKESQAKDPSMYATTALLNAANKNGVELKTLVNGKDLQVNSDVISLVRKKASSSIRLGLDLNGGVEFMLELVPDENFLNSIKKEVKNDKNAQAQYEKRLTTEFNRYRDIAIETLRSRMEAQKIYEAEITPAGGRYISLKVPVVSKEEKLKLLRLIKMSAKLRFRFVNPDNEKLVQQYLAGPKKFRSPIGFDLMKIKEFRSGKKELTRYYFVNKRWAMDGKSIIDAYPTKDQFGQRKIILKFNSAGAERFGEITSKNKGRQLAIVLDDKLYCAPVIRDAITTGSAEISGNFSNEEAKNISDALVSGSLPFQIRVEGIFDTDPTLGVANVQNGIWAGIFALAIVMAFMIFYYLRAGVVAVIALGVNIILVLGALAAFDATLTLPGIAGIILTIGMSVDANVLIFERIREELERKKSLQTAIELGYSRAFITILDSNLTTLFTALILMRVGTGPVKGFAVTLSIGILTSMFTALFLTRLIFDYIDRVHPFKGMKMLTFVRNPKIDFVGLRKYAFTLSGVLIVASLLVFGAKGKTMFGVDFTGGTQITFDYQKRVPVNKVEDTLKKAGYEAQVSYKTSASQVDNKKVEILIRKNIKLEKTGSGEAVSPKEQIAGMLNKTYPASKFSGGQETSIGGLVGYEFTKSALLAIGLAFLGIIIYISIRFEFAYAIASIIALIHDVIVATGIFVACGNEVSLSVVAAILTIIGYSLNDTIVVFDRIREDVRQEKGLSYKQIINLSINQTLSRTTLTSFTTALVLIILYFFGGIAINDFVFVMLLGVIVGTYSSIFVASPIVAFWHRKIGSRIKDDAPVPVRSK
ncbi:protein translocase subunit SecD [Lentisphaerota bacterium ZTH]|nr:protein translocase subunit SecD [Lentisphaerota bacterium]WET05760.1 protein translocase subunit SecD [Lentisphaerota bacterium ZTH]